MGSMRVMVCCVGMRIADIAVTSTKAVISIR